MWIHSLELNTGEPAGTDLYCDVYRRNGTYAGFELIPAAWTPISAGRGVTAGLDTPSQIDLAEPFRLPAGSYGFAIVANNFGHRYTNGANTYSNASLQIDLGSATNQAFANSGTPPFSPRTANINLKHRTDLATAQNMRYHTIMRRDELGSSAHQRERCVAAGVGEREQR